MSSTMDLGAERGRAGDGRWSWRGWAVRADELDLRDVLEFNPDGGVMTFAGQRALLMDAVALGLLRHQLIELLGPTAARGVLTRFGYSHGWRTAEALRDALPWDHPSQWRVAGGRLHRLQGLVSFEPDPSGESFAAALWKDSYEAEQHLLHVGLAEAPVCWTLCGFASGYLSRAFKRKIYCVETACVGCGDAVCRMEGRPAEEWGEAIEGHRAFYEQESLDEALEAVRVALAEAEGRLRRQRAMASAWASPEEVCGIVARSEEMRAVVELARRVARVDATVLITGESGVGKERLARLIHEESARAGRAFVAVNCGAVSPELLESELFGHKKGAFTGATQDRVGLFEAASGGTLFLDEVGEVSAGMQVKLLRVLQERQVRRVGENRPRSVDVRIVAATNRDLSRRVAEGEMRKDFYYRLRVVELEVAPLARRRADILPLARRFLAEIAPRLGQSHLQGFSPGACERLLAHGWPGNVRELRNAVERAVALAQGERIEAVDLPPELSGEGSGGDATVRLSAGGIAPLAEVERAHILAALEAVGGNRREAAEALGIGVATLYRRLKGYRR